MYKVIFPKEISKTQRDVLGDFGRDVPFEAYCVSLSPCGSFVVVSPAKKL